jgi:hypothetical protein
VTTVWRLAYEDIIVFDEQITHLRSTIDVREMTAQSLLEVTSMRVTVPTLQEAARCSVHISPRWLHILAERVGFEPTVRLHVHTLSKRAP